MIPVAVVAWVRRRRLAGCLNGFRDLQSLAALDMICRRKLVHLGNETERANTVIVNRTFFTNTVIVIAEINGALARRAKLHTRSVASWRGGRSFVASAHCIAAGVLSKARIRHCSACQNAHDSFDVVYYASRRVGGGTEKHFSVDEDYSGSRTVERDEGA